MISGFVGKDNNKKVYVYFTQDNKNAEGELPACRIFNNNGFSDSEVEELRSYLADNKEDIINEARKINPMRAFLGR